MSVTFEDRSGAFMQRLVEKANAACAAAAEELSEAYKRELSEIIAPPHSSPGNIPHAYDGPARGGYDRTKTLSKLLGVPITKNNPVEVGFAKTQTDRLYTYIQSGSSNSGAVVGFAKGGSHVSNRQYNYLIAYDLGGDTCPNPLAVSITANQQRPWIRPIFESVQESLADTVRSFLTAGEVSGDVPF